MDCLTLRALVICGPSLQDVNCAAVNLSEWMKHKERPLQSGIFDHAGVRQHCSAESNVRGL